MGFFSEFKGKVILDYDYINRLSLELLFNLSRALLRYGVRLEKVMKKLDCTYTGIYPLKSLHEKKRIFIPDPSGGFKGNGGYEGRMEEPEQPCPEDQGDCG
uniref:hypothetical protein n=1 Tax=Clostridium sp. NkU-1 TaxID=1095009 RepID=UPI000AAE29D9